MKRSELKSLIKEILKEHAVSSINASRVVLKDIVEGIKIHSNSNTEFQRKYGLLMRVDKDSIEIKEGISEFDITTPEPNGMIFPKSFHVEIKITPLQTWMNAPKSPKI